MRSLLFIFVLIVCSAGGTFAQENHQHQEQTGDSQADVPFGTYGYRHGELHKYGTIVDLLKKTGGSCCDGGYGGECRVTEIKEVDGKPYFLHNEKWCPVDTEISIRRDVSLPLGVQAVVCAPKSDPNVCPNATYCAARVDLQSFIDKNNK